jgi:hypothetical protein
LGCCSGAHSGGRVEGDYGVAHRAALKLADRRRLESKRAGCIVNLFVREWGCQKLNPETQEERKRGNLRVAVKREKFMGA